MSEPHVEKQKPVPPFVQFCCAAVPMVFDDSLSYYEALCAMWKYLDETVKVINNNALVTEDYIAKVEELHEYVEHYFDNLDVQQEINNKLDAMVEDGTLTSIIGYYVDDTIVPMIDAQNSRIVHVEQELASVASGSPLVASSTAEMTDTTRVYVNTTDGHWYYYADNQWNDGGVYQATDGGALEDEITALNTKVENLSAKTFETGFNKKNLGDADVTSLPLYNSVPSSSPNPAGITIYGLSGYDTYWFVMPEDHDIYVLNNANYVALCTSTNYTSTQSYVDGYFLLGDAGSRKRNIDNNLPDSPDNAMSVTAGTAVVVTVTAGVTPVVMLSGYSNTLNEDVELNQSQIDQITSENYCRVKYSTATPTAGNLYTTELFEIYLPTYSGYIKYNFHHVENADINADNWRIRNALKANSNFENGAALTSDGEWECAVRIVDRDDFSGGALHGDEVVTNIKFFVNGKETSKSTLLSLTKFAELKIVEATNLYDPADHTTIIAEHGKEYIFNKDGLTINQSINWKVAANLSSCYLAMFPVLKSVTTDYYLNTSFDSDTIAFGSTPKCTDAKVYSTDAKFMADFNIPKYIEGLTGGDSLLITDNSGQPYNKMYYVACTSHQTTVGELWQTTTFYKLDAAA